MRAVVTRVLEARVEVAGTVVGAIAQGVLVLLGVGIDDRPEDAAALARKIRDLRIFRDAEGAMNLGLVEAGGGALVVSQFTLYGDARKGRRPSFIAAAPPERGRELYERFVAALRELGTTVATGEFGATMLVASVNDGPVTILIDTEKTF
ncbi:MAG: D-tyrosyl-tRNA(Tyr) deacylase [Candidatus Eremiobacteraeota bacterium]|nr:D-tyrosyl-tRNA(Tyr) deacylase [Candidatus Eremiobacteraeota bacterium]